MKLFDTSYSALLESVAYILLECGEDRVEYDFYSDDDNLTMSGQHKIEKYLKKIEKEIANKDLISNMLSCHSQNHLQPKYAAEIKDQFNRVFTRISYHILNDDSKIQRDIPIVKLVGSRWLCHLIAPVIRNMLNNEIGYATYCMNTPPETINVYFYMNLLENKEDDYYNYLQTVKSSCKSYREKTGKILIEDCINGFSLNSKDITESALNKEWEYTTNVSAGENLFGYITKEFILSFGKPEVAYRKLNKLFKDCYIYNDPSGNKVIHEEDIIENEDYSEVILKGTRFDLGFKGYIVSDLPRSPELDIFKKIIKYRLVKNKIYRYRTLP